MRMEITSAANSEQFVQVVTQGRALKCLETRLSLPAQEETAAPQAKQGSSALTGADHTFHGPGQRLEQNVTDAEA